MVYDIVLNSGQEINCWADNVGIVLDMFFTHDIFVVAENSYPDKVTYLLKEDVSHIRFPRDAQGVDEPVE